MFLRKHQLYSPRARPKQASENFSAAMLYMCTGLLQYQEPIISKYSSGWVIYILTSSCCSRLVPRLYSAYTQVQCRPIGLRLGGII